MNSPETHGVGPPRRGFAAEERERLLLEHLPQVRYLARRIHDRLPAQVPLEDLVHAGVVGLIDAVDKFDPSKNVPLSPTRNSAFAEQLWTAFAKWTGARDDCGAKPGGSRKRIVFSNRDWDGCPPSQR